MNADVESRYFDLINEPIAVATERFVKLFCLSNDVRIKLLCWLRT